MDYSELSGSPIEPDAKEELIVRSSDGRARRITVTAAEAAKLTSSGEPIGGRWSEMKAFARRNWRTFAWWTFGLVVVLVLMPAATKQWADRQAALTLKSNVVADMYKSTVSATVALHDAVEMKNESQARKAATHTLDVWSASVARVDGVYRVYFDGTKAIDHWHEYRGAMYDYIYIVCDDKARRGEDVSSVKQYFQAHDIPVPAPMDLRVLRSSPIIDSAFRKAYESTGLELLTERAELALELRSSHTSGYSSGPIDFLRDVLPGL